MNFEVRGLPQLMSRLKGEGICEILIVYYKRGGVTRSVTLHILVQV